MQKKVLRCFAIALIAVTQLGGCAGMGTQDLPSGERVAVTRIGRIYFSQGPPALTISFNSAYDPETNFGDLQRETDELFVFEENIIDAAHLDNVILQANHRTGGSAFVSTSRGYNFVYHKTPSGWCKYQPDRSCVPFAKRGSRVDAVAPNPSALSSRLGILIAQRYAALETAYNRDPKMFGEFLAPGFVQTDIEGQQMSGEQLIETLESRPKDPKRVVEHKLLALKSKEQTLVAQRRLDDRYVTPSAGGGNMQVEYIVLSTDTWVNVDGSWMLQASEVNQEDYYLNGLQIYRLSGLGTASPN